MPTELAEQKLAAFKEDGLDHLYLAWAGPVSKDEAHYYRIHGGDFVVEFDKTPRTEQTTSTRSGAMLKTTLRQTCYETTSFCTTFSDSTSLVRPNKKGPGMFAGAFFITYLWLKSQ
ncbi:MAG: hypothetical protein CM1200mP27_03450 [Chloroflexota bacterium]|nr:MAG: hypothetical protein CM1200mP27_03450 [Chloroflexota bacterium]